MGNHPVLSTFPAGHRLAGRPAWYLDGTLIPVISGGDGPTSTTTAPGLLDKLHAKRNEHVETLGRLLADQEEARSKFEALTKPDDKATDEARAAYTKAETELRDSEATFKAQWDPTFAEVNALEERINAHSLVADRRAKAAQATRGGAVVTNEPLTYNPYTEHSYFGDMAAYLVKGVNIRKINPGQAEERLKRHAKEMDVELPIRAQRRAAKAEREMRSMLGDNAASPFERRVNPNRTDGQGGYFVPPLWLIDEYIPGLRAGRVVANLCKQMELPEGTDSINIPKLSTLTSTGVQGVDNAGVTSQDYTDTSVQANVKTLAGQEDVAIQLIEQSPGQIVDQVIMTDLVADFNRLVDRQVTFGNGASSSSLNGGQLLGLYPSTNWASTNSVTYTSGTPTGYAFMQSIGQSISQIAENRFDVTNVKVILHPRRWFWFATSLDGNNRPLVVPGQYGPYNNIGSTMEDGTGIAEGLVGSILPGFQSYIDANVPTNDTTGGGTGQDVAITAKFDDCWLFEGELRTRVLPEILSGTLQLRYQVYGYLAFLVRYGQSLAIVTGSGMAAPSGY
jgi:HK97 family phage major capsid protein